MQGTHQAKSDRLWIAVLATSLLYVASHPPWSLWALALVAVAPVSAALLDSRRRVSWPRAALAGFVFGAMSTCLLVGQWSWPAAREFFAASRISALGFPVSLPLLASGIALHYAIAFALIARLAGLGAMVGVIGSASVWASAELARTSLGDGDPWGAFAVALIAADSALSGFHAETPVAGLLSVGGSPLVALVAAAVGASLGLAWNQRRSAVERGRALAAGAALAAVSLAVSHAGLALGPLRDDASVPAQPLRVALVQSGFDRSRLLERAGTTDSFDRHVDLTRGSETRGADLIVWPESALPFLLDAHVDNRDALRELARDRGAALLVGGPRSTPGSDGGTSVFRSAFFFPADGSEPIACGKQVLQPFMQYVPRWIASILALPQQGPFVSGRVAGSGGSVTPGRADEATPDFFTVKGWRIAPLLCFGMIYPGGTAARTAERADLLVNLSNDSWFDAGAGPEQHFTLAMLASAETRRPLVRVASSGVSGLIAENGLVSWRLPVGAGAVALLDVVPPRRDSLFVRGGHVGVTLLVLAIAMTAVALPGRLRRAEKDAPREGELS